MNSLKVTAAVIDALEAAGVEYMLVGAYSANAYGVTRSTNDADIVVILDADKRREVIDRLGSDFDFDPQMKLEGFTGSLRNVVNHVPTGFQIELFRLNKNDDHHRERFQRRRRMFLAEIDREVWLPTPEDVIIQKLRWQRRKDLDDAATILAVNSPNLDWNYINSWTRNHGTQELMQELMQSLPKLDDLNEA
jgi:hypothetical protein